MGWFWGLYKVGLLWAYIYIYIYLCIVELRLVQPHYRYKVGTAPQAPPIAVALSPGLRGRPPPGPRPPGNSSRPSRRPRPASERRGVKIHLQALEASGSAKAALHAKSACEVARLRIRLGVAYMGVDLFRSALGRHMTTAIFSDLAGRIKSV